MTTIEKMEAAAKLPKVRHLLWPSYPWPYLPWLYYYCGCTAYGCTC